VCHTVIDPNSSPLNQTSSGTSHPLSNVISYDKFSTSHRALLTAITNHDEPKYFSQAIKDDRWKDAMRKEISALEENQTWTYAILPAGKRVLGCKWVYKIKYNADGTVERFKARLVILGNTQVEGEDFTETFAPVAKMDTVRCLLSVAVSKGWELHQMDVQNAFLHGDLDEEIYMKPPPGFVAPRSHLVCKLKKSLYGLRQALRQWFFKLATALRQHGFRQTPLDHL